MSGKMFHTPKGMSLTQAVQLLEEFPFRPGYAADIASSIHACWLHGDATMATSEADTMFRSLVLDDAYSVQVARRLWSAAHLILDNMNGGQG